MSQFGLWLLPLLLSSLIGVGACLRSGLKWTWGYFAQHVLVGAISIMGFFFSPDWAYAAAGWILFLIFNLGRRIVSNGISSDLSLIRLPQARRKAVQLRLLAWGPPGRFWHDLVTIVDSYAHRDFEAVNRLTEKWRTFGIPAQMNDALMAYSMLGQMLVRDWLGIIRNFEECLARKPGRFPTQAAIPAARAYLELGRAHESIATLEAADLAGSMYARDTVETLLLSFFALLGDRAEVEALLAGLRSPKVLPEYARNFWRGRCEFVRGNLEESIRLYEEAGNGLSPADSGWRDRLTFQAAFARTRLEEGGGAQPVMAPENNDARLDAVARGKQLLANAILVSELISPSKRGPAIKALAVIISSIYMAQCMATIMQNSVLANFWVGAFAAGVLDGVLVLQGQIWRLFTYIFLHANLSHVLMNVLGLVWLGTNVERLFGTWRFLLIYIASGVLSGLAQALLTPEQLAVGASGAVMGVFGASAAATVRLKNVLPAPVRRYELRWMLSLAVVQLSFDQIVNLAFKINQHAGSHVWIASAAHAGGMLSGFLLGFILPLKPLDTGKSDASS